MRDTTIIEDVRSTPATQGGGTFSLLQLFLLCTLFSSPAEAAFSRHGKFSFLAYGAGFWYMLYVKVKRPTRRILRQTFQFILGHLSLRDGSGFVLGNLLPSFDLLRVPKRPTRVILT